MGQMVLATNGDAIERLAQGKVNVNDRALLDEVLARYPGGFTSKLRAESPNLSPAATLA